MSLANQASNSYSRTTPPKESTLFQRPPDSTHYHLNVPTSRCNGRKVDSASLLLLANCATLATTTNDGMQIRTSTDIPKVSNVRSHASLSYSIK